MSFIRFWIGFSLIGIAVAIVLLGWSIRRRQFREPDRAAMLPFGGAAPVPPPPARWSREASVLATILGTGMAVLAASVVLSLVW